MSEMSAVMHGQLKEKKEKDERRAKDAAEANKRKRAGRYVLLGQE